MDFTGIAKTFTSHYYTTFDSGLTARGKLASLYRPESMLTWEKSKYLGMTAIQGALQKPELGTLKHQVSSVDAQPTSGGGVMVLVVGTLALNNAVNKPARFVESFNLQPIPGQSAGLFIHNQFFRLILG